MLITVVLIFTNDESKPLKELQG